MTRTPTQRPAAALLLVVALGAFGPTGCPRAPPPDLSADPGELLSAVQARQARVHSVAGGARLRFDTPALKGSVEALVAAERPDRLRVEALDFFGSPVAMLVVAEGRYLFVDARRGTFTLGDATPENVASLLPLPISAEQLVAALCGSAPLVASPPVDATPGRGVMRLTLAGGDVVQRLEIGAGAAVERSSVRKRGVDGERPVGCDLAFATFRNQGGVNFPMEVRLDAREAGARLEIQWRKDPSVNGEPNPALFRLEPPPGLRPAEMPQGVPVPFLPSP